MRTDEQRFLIHFHHVYFDFEDITGLQRAYRSQGDAFHAIDSKFPNLLGISPHWISNSDVEQAGSDIVNWQGAAQKVFFLGGRHAGPIADRGTLAASIVCLVESPPESKHSALFVDADLKQFWAVGDSGLVVPVDASKPQRISGKLAA